MKKVLDKKNGLVMGLTLATATFAWYYYGDIVRNNKQDNGFPPSPDSLTIAIGVIATLATLLAAHQHIKNESNQFSMLMLWILLVLTASMIWIIRTPSVSSHQEVWTIAGSFAVVALAVLTYNMSHFDMNTFALLAAWAAVIPCIIYAWYYQVEDANLVTDQTKPEESYVISAGVLTSLTALILTYYTYGNFKKHNLVALSLLLMIPACVLFWIMNDQAELKNNYWINSAILTTVSLSLLVLYYFQSTKMMKKLKLKK